MEEAPVVGGGVVEGLAVPGRAGDRRGASRRREDGWRIGRRGTWSGPKQKSKADTTRCHHTFKPTEDETYGDAIMFHAAQTRGMRGARFPGVRQALGSGKAVASVIDVIRRDLARRHRLQVVKVVAVVEREGRVRRAVGQAANTTAQVWLDVSVHGVAARFWVCSNAQVCLAPSI